MTPAPLHLQFHSKVSVSIVFSKASHFFLKSVLTQTFSTFCSSDPTRSPFHLEVQVGKFDLSKKKQKLHRVDDHYFVGEDCLYSKHRHKIARWESYVQGLEGKNLKLNVYGNFPSYWVFPFESILQWMYFLFCRAELYPIHALGVTRNQRAFLLVGRSGVGKSFLGGKFLREGYKLLGEDTVLIGSDGMVYGFHLALGLRLHQKSASDYQLHYSLSDRLGLWATKGIKVLTLGKICLLFKIRSSRLGDQKLEMKGHLKKGLMAMGSTGDRLTIHSPEEKSFSITQQSWNWESISLQKLLAAYLYIHTDSSLKDLNDRYSKQVSKAFALFPSSTFPLQLQEEYFKQVLEFAKDE